jgi:hypothetical protein
MAAPHWAHRPWTSSPPRAGRAGGDLTQSVDCRAVGHAHTEGVAMRRLRLPQTRKPRKERNRAWHELHQRRSPRPTHYEDSARQENPLDLGTWRPARTRYVRLCPFKIQALMGFVRELSVKLPKGPLESIDERLGTAADISRSGRPVRAPNGRRPPRPYRVVSAAVAKDPSLARWQLIWPSGNRRAC